jgi:hypothetical protein
MIKVKRKVLSVSVKAKWKTAANGLTIYSMEIVWALNPKNKSNYLRGRPQ